ncbi:hypothetical protein GCM10020216_107980 [Nonomuraea helvata]
MGLPREGIEIGKPEDVAGLVVEDLEAPAPSSSPPGDHRVAASGRAGFITLLHEAAVGDIIRVADPARSFRIAARLRWRPAGDGLASSAR